MKLIKRVNRLFGHLGLTAREERPLDFHLTQEDIESELHYPQETTEWKPEVRVAFLAAVPKS